VRAPRRNFIQHLIVVGVGGSALATARAQTHVSPSDPQATALGYVEDSTKADEKKFPKHTADQHCNGCALGKFKEGDAWGDCPLFAGRQVSAKGWCSAWTKKA
jgi:high potential iron-sulfur protein